MKEKDWKKLLNEGKLLTESQWTRYADTDEQEQAIKEVEEWVKKLGKRIVGGTTVGKRPQRVILDLTYQGGEISIDSEGAVEIGADDIPIKNFVGFKKAVEDLEKVREK